MDVTLLGTGSAFPSSERVQTGTLLESDGRRLLVDCGSGVVHRLAQAGVSHLDVETVLLTHHHLDHVADLPTLLKACVLDGQPSLSIHGPPGTAAVCETLFSVDDVGAKADYEVTERDGSAFPATIAGFEVEAVQGTHPKQSFAYRFDDAFVVSGDTAPEARVTEHADGAHTLLHECSYPDGTETDTHTTPSALAELVGEIDIEQLYLTHLFPVTEPVEEEVVDTVAAATDASVAVARDHTTFTVPT